MIAPTAERTGSASNTTGVPSQTHGNRALRPARTMAQWRSTSGRAASGNREATGCPVWTGNDEAVDVEEDGRPVTCR
jgi:hypothetical protein